MPVRFSWRAFLCLGGGIPRIWGHPCESGIGTNGDRAVRRNRDHDLEVSVSASRVGFSSLRRRVAVAGAAVVLALAASTVAAGPASAAAPNGCPRGSTCLYSGYDYGNDWVQNGSTLPFQYCIDKLSRYRYENVVSSVYNNGRTDRVQLFERENKSGRVIAVDRDSGLNNLNDRAFNDIMSSAYFQSQLSYSRSVRCS